MITPVVCSSSAEVRTVTAVKSNATRRKPSPYKKFLSSRPRHVRSSGVDGLVAALASHFDEEFEELVKESDFQEEPRTLDEIQQAEGECFDRISYQRSFNRELRTSVRQT